MLPPLAFARILELKANFEPQQMQLKILIFVASYVSANVMVRNICRAAKHADGLKGQRKREPAGGTCTPL